VFDGTLNNGKSKWGIEGKGADRDRAENFKHPILPIF
jgi:hypothetical protein